MKRRGLLLLEVLVGLVLLAVLGVTLLRIQSGALRQWRSADQQERLREQVEQLLWDWQLRGERVTLPAVGRIADRWRWVRSAGPGVLEGGLVATAVTLEVFDDREAAVRPILRLDWLVPQPAGGGR